MRWCCAFVYTASERGVCSTLNCSDVCLMTSTTTARCGCLPGLTLDRDNRHCTGRSCSVIDLINIFLSRFSLYFPRFFTFSMF